MSVTLEKDQLVQQGNFTLRDALGELSKDALTIIRKNLSVKNVSKLNRDQLLEALIEQLPERMAAELPSLMLLMDEERIAVLERATNKNGIIVVNEKWTELMTKYWQELALLFKQVQGQRTMMVMPVELISVVREALAALNRKKVELNTALLSAVKGMVYYYGVLTHEQLEQVIARYPMFQQLGAEPLHIIIHYRHYCSDFALNEKYIHHASIPDPTLIVTEQKKREHLSYAAFTIHQLQEAAQPGFVLRTEAHRLLVDALMKQLKLTQLEANLVADQSEFGIRAGLQLQDLLEYVGKELQLDEEALKLLLPRFIIMYNNTPQWCLKGYYSVQLTKGPEENQSKPAKEAVPSLGRNDICYCGSGKKYKKCCMNK